MSVNISPRLLSHKGFSVEYRLSADELSSVRAFIKEQWLYRLQLLQPTLVSQFDTTGIEYYHELSHLIDHQSAWPSNSRVLSKSAVTAIKAMNFYKKLCEAYGAITIADEEGFGWENMLWRIVRPGNTDCAPLHVDKWFWELGEHWKVPDYPYQCINVWIAIYTEVNKNGLLVVPGSHCKKDWSWHTEVRFGKNKPIIDENLEQVEIQLLPTNPGDIVVFDHDLLHGGAPNCAMTTRVSLEFTLFVPI